MTGRRETVLLELRDTSVYAVPEHNARGERNLEVITLSKLGRVSSCGSVEDEMISLPAFVAPDDEPYAHKPCMQSPDDFFPEKGGSVKYPSFFCKECEVRLGCATGGLTGREDFGVWGGLSTNDIRKLRKNINDAISSSLTDLDGKIDAFYDVLSGRDPIAAVRRVFVATIIDGLYGAEHAGPVVKDEISMALSDQEMVRQAIESAKNFYDSEAGKIYNRLQTLSELRANNPAGDKQLADDEQV